MSTALRDESDYKTREAVEEELRWTPAIADTARIGVSVNEGIVTLAGEVSTYPQKLAAGEAALRTHGVTAIANDIAIVIPDRTYTDARLAIDARDALQLNSNVPRDSVEVEVRDHVIHLTGAVAWDFQRRAAQRSAEALSGATSVVNDINLSPRPSSTQTHAMIRNALERNASIDADHVVVTISDHTVTLTGAVSSCEEKRQAGLAAWRSPNVKWVHNQLRVEPPR